MDIAKKIVGYLKTKTAVVVLAVLLFGGLGYYYKNLLVAASVNGSFISRWSVISEMEKTAGKNALDSLITKKLIEKEVASKNITVSQADVEAQIKNIEEQLKSQGGTLEGALKERGMSMADLKEQITINKSLQQMLADKVAVTDTDVDAYIKQMGGDIPSSVSEAEFKSQIKAQLENQKFSTEAQAFIDSLRAQANIKYFVSY